jgi:hypothetical protein
MTSENANAAACLRDFATDTIRVPPPALNSRSVNVSTTCGGPTSSDHYPGSVATFLAPVVATVALRESDEWAGKQAGGAVDNAFGN